MNSDNLTLRQKILQMFITGFEGENFSDNKLFTDLIHDGLGGIIFFTHNIKTQNQIKSSIEEIKKHSSIPMFFSIDQEGGRVERTENIHSGKKYLSAKFAYGKGLDFLKKQTNEIAEELNKYGFNMNFAPVLDVNTNKNNPIIGERAFSDNPIEVIKASEIVLKEYLRHNIITVGKHFPGHGDASSDSHKTLPTINLSKEELKNIHISPFKKAIELGIPAIMVAHVLYPVFENESLPASISKKIITNILIKELNFKGLIITDDMEMNGIKGFNRFEACKRAIAAGINMFIFRDTTEDIIKLIYDIEKAVINKEIDLENINISVNKIINLKHQYKIIS